MAKQASPVAPSRAERFEVLDGLRGFAAVAIVFVHYLVGIAHRIPAVGWTLRILDMSPLSLDVFFVLSGFLIGSILLRAKGKPAFYTSFYKRRAARILPVYYAWIGLFAVLYALGSGWGNQRPDGMGNAFYLLSFAFLFQNFFPAIVESSYMLAPTWTLVVEEHFYLLIPVAVKKLSSRRLVQALLGVVVFAPIFRAVLFRAVGHRAEWADIATRIWPICRADALAIGVLLALAWRSDTARNWVRSNLRIFYWAMPICFAFASFMTWMDVANQPHGRVLNTALGRTAIEWSSLCLIVALICRPQSWMGRFLSSKVMQSFAKLSYCIYVVHWGIYWMLFRYVLHLKFGERMWVDLAMAPVAFLLTWGISALSWKYFEHPIMKAVQNTTPPRTSSVTAPAAAIERQPQTA